jgi:hypothetical protein
VKGKVSQQLSVFVYFLKKLPVIKVKKEEGKHEAKEELAHFNSKSTKNIFLDL